MATQEEKLKALKDMFGEERAARILEVAEQAETKATASKLDFKEHDGEQTATTKAEKAKKTMPMEEGTPMEEDAETASEEETETPEEETPAPKAKGKKKESPAPVAASQKVDVETEVETEPEDVDVPEDDYVPLGDLDTKEFGGLLAEAMVAAMQPVIQELVTVKEAMEAITLKSKEPAAPAKLPKEAQDRIDALEKQIKQATKELSELKGDLPRSLASNVKGFKASEDASTVVKEDNPLLESQPKSDPLTAFSAFALGSQPGVQPGA